MTKVVDFFPYYDPTGKEVTELKVKLWNDQVDEFIIVESDKTHSGLPAQQGLEELIERAGLPKEKIRIIKLKIGDDPQPIEVDFVNCYEDNTSRESLLGRTRERLQKDALLSVLDDYDDDTIFIIGDQDEIINPAYFPWIKSVVLANPNVILKIPMVQLEGRADRRAHIRNTGEPKVWDTPVSVVMKSHLKNVSPISIRGCTQTVYPTIYLTLDGMRVEDMGWHFSWMGGPKERLAKVEGFAHYADKFDFLLTADYSSIRTKEFLSSDMSMAPGAVSPSCNKTEMLWGYPLENLPQLIFELDRVKKYLLP